MVNIKISPFAAEDLEEVIAYFSGHNVNSAQKLALELKKQFILLSANPQMGKLHEKYVIGMRSFSYKRYVIFYFPTEDGIEIYRVIHDARDIDDLFESQFEGLKP
jgi:toxin ParE1/3/4